MPKLAVTWSPPGDDQLPAIPIDAGPEGLAFDAQPLRQPQRISRRAPSELHTFHLHDGHAQIPQLSRCGIEGGKVQQGQITAIVLVTADTLVVGQEIATTVDDGAAVMDLDGFRVMGRVPVNDVDTSVVDQSVGEADLVVAAVMRLV